MAQDQSNTLVTESKASVDFWNEVDAIADDDGRDFSELSTASTIRLEFDNINGTDQIAQDGKYVLAEFVARNSNDGFDYTYYNDDVDDASAAADISMYSQSVVNGTLSRQIDDGSDVTVLGDTYYENPFSFAARINSNDARTALKIRQILRVLATARLTLWRLILIVMARSPLAMRWTFYARQHLWILTMQILVLSGPMSEM